MLIIRHVLPGRLRLGLAAIKGRPDLASKLHTRLETVSGINRVTVDTRTGSVLMLFDPMVLKSPRFLIDLSGALGSLFPAHFAPGRLSFTSRRFKGHPDLVRRIESQMSTLRGIERIEIDPATGVCNLLYDPCVVTAPGFFESLAKPLSLLVPRLDASKLLYRLGLKQEP